MSKDSGEEETTAGSVLYRVVHGWPMLLGLPVPLFLGLAVGGLFLVFGGSMAGGLLMSGLAIAVVVAAWAVLAWVFSKDRVALPRFLVTRRASLRSVISSFSPGQSRVRVVPRRW